MPLKKNNIETDIYKMLSNAFDIDEKELKKISEIEIQELIKLKQENDKIYSNMKDAAKSIKGKITGKSFLNEKASNLTKEQRERLRNTKTWNSYYQKLYPEKGLKSIKMTDSEYELYVDSLVLAPKIDASNPMKSFDSFCDATTKK